MLANALPIHQPWDQKIRLEPGKKPTFGLIYALIGVRIAHTPKIPG